MRAQRPLSSYFGTMGGLCPVKQSKTTDDVGTGDMLHNDEGYLRQSLVEGTIGWGSSSRTDGAERRERVLTGLRTVGYRWLTNATRWVLFSRAQAIVTCQL